MTSPTEVAQCLYCPREFERIARPKGNLTVYCSRSCRNYASRDRIAARGGDPAGIAKFHEQQARRAQLADPVRGNLLTVIHHIPELAQVLGAVQSAHGHESLMQRTPTESVTSATAHPTAMQNNTTPNQTRRRAKGKKL